jgi:acetoin utilization deacetylase AcuC-like enzyme
LCPPALDITYSERYALPRTTALTVPQDPQRAERILTFLLRERWLYPDDVQVPRAASLRSLRRIHDDDYLRSLEQADALTRIVGVAMEEPEADALLRLQRYMVGGTNLAARRALASGRLAVNLGGGLHHAKADQGQGFCIFNDVAVTIASLRHHGFDGPILVVDLDLHHGDGTEAIFADDPTVHTFSIHNQDWGRPEAVECTRVELGHGVHDGPYLEALRSHLPPVVERFRPAFTFYLAGVDPAEGDRIGDWHITPAGMLARDRFVLELCRGSREVPMVITLAGGYGDEAWRYSARFLGMVLNGGRVVEPPTTDEVTLARYRTLARLLNPRQLTGLAPEDDWGLTEEDLVGLASPPRESRFLGYYSLHGIEMVLEAYGILDRLRALGFRDFHLQWELDDPSGQTLRLFAGLGRRYLLMELRAKRDRRTVPGLDLLRVEWLLLQNPKAAFPPGRPPLPGQEHPGLGMLRDVVALLVVACERLQLDGLSFVPGHYHLAVASAPLLRFLRPRDRALFRALEVLLQDLSVAEASRAIDGGRVVHRDTGAPLIWPAPPMVLPVSERMREKVLALEREETETEAPVLELRQAPEGGNGGD